MKLRAVIAAPVGCVSVASAGFLGGGLLASSCVPVEPAPIELEVFNWWQKGAERDALDSVASLHEARHSEIDVQDEGQSDADVARELLATRLLSQAPPATFQANAGADLLRWTVVDSYRKPGSARISHSHIADVSELLQRTKMLEHIPQPVLDALSVGGPWQPGSALYGVPLDIHRLNVMYYNVARVEAFERDTGKKLQDLSTLCPESGDPGERLGLRVALGAKDAFSLMLLTFENVLPALAGKDFYNKLWRGEAPPNWPDEVRRALTCVQHLSRSVAPDVNPATLGWKEAAAMVADASGRADFTIMGDWADGTLRDALEPTGDKPAKVASMPFPGTDGIYVFTSDCFPLPVGTPHQKEAEEFLETLASPEAQLLFSKEKGSIPARYDVNVESLGARAVAAMDAFKAADEDGAVIQALSGLLPYYFPQNDLASALVAMVQPNAGEADIDIALQTLREAYPILTRWQTRLREGAAPPVP